MRRSLTDLVGSRLIGSGAKKDYELAYWRKRAQAEGVLRNHHYEPLYTTMFELSTDFYSHKRILDIGCGPRGSLEWAADAGVRVGLDPLTSLYLEFGIAAHAMNYVCARAEQMPFADGQFDVVTSLNSLDHVDDVDAVLDEIRRVTKPGGSLLLEVEVGHEPTRTEPIVLWFDVAVALQSSFEMVYEKRFELPSGGHFIHDAFRFGGPFDESKGRHPGVLVAHMKRVAKAG